MKMELLITCPVCRCPRIPILVDGLVTYHQCEDCGQVFLSPRMADDTTAEYYAGIYRDLLGQVNPDGSIGTADLNKQHERAMVQARMCKGYIRGSSMLEIGCSAGYLLQEMKERFGMDGVGIEPDARYHRIDPAKRFEMHLDILEVGERRFDLIAMSHSLEHLNYPLEYLVGLRERHAHAETLFLIEVPNYEYAPGALQLHHPFAFTAGTLRGLMARAGMRTLFEAVHGLGKNAPLFLLGIWAVNGER